MEIKKVVLNRTSKNYMRLIYDNHRWHAFKVNYRMLFYIVFALLSALVIKLIMTVDGSKEYSKPQPQKIIEQSIYRV